jgi:CRP-like cAMP-binding protein
MISVDACEPYFEYVRKYVELDAETMQLVASQVNEITFPEKQIILSEGAICNKVYFVLSGTARSYYIDPSGVTVTWSFHFNNNRSLIRNAFVTDYRAFLTNKPSSIVIETLSELIAVVFTREAVKYLIEKSLNYEIWMRKLDEMAYLSMFDRAFSLLTMSATERYHKLLTDEPHLMQMFSNYYIASYLGIAPQSLSRIRTQH